METNEGDAPGHPPAVHSREREDGREHFSVRPPFTSFLRGELRYPRHLPHPPNRVISGAPPACRAISSRARSPVVAMPCTLSLNSSTLDAHRSASSTVTNPC